MAFPAEVFTYRGIRICNVLFFNRTVLLLFGLYSHRDSGTPVQFFNTQHRSNCPVNGKLIKREVNGAFAK